MSQAVEIVPFTFAGYPDIPVYLHPCGTVLDVPAEATDLIEQLATGECDCETPGRWMLIYVERER